MINEHFYKPPDDKEWGVFFWGTSGIDNSKLKTWDSEKTGEIIINEEYDISLESSQLHY